MSNRRSLVSSRVGLAIIGAVVVGGISTAIAVGPMLVRSAPSTNTAQPQTNAATSAEPTQDATPSPASSATAREIPETTPTTAGASAPTPTHVAPTATPTHVPPTPTPIPVQGQPLTVRGTVTSVTVINSTFMVHVFNNGGTYTCTVTPSTRWSGAASSITTLQVGMQVDVSGTYQGGGGVTASSVDAQIDH